VKRSALKSFTGSIFVTKKELLYLCNIGQLRVLVGRVSNDLSNSERLFSVGLSTSPLDVDNCCVVRFEVGNFAQQVDKSAVKQDLFLLEARDVIAIAPIKKVDLESLKDLVDMRYQSLFIDPIEEQWQSWMHRESIRIHRRSFDRLLEWSGQKKMTKAESTNPRTEALLAIAMGHNSVEKPGEDDLSVRFLAAIKHLAEEVGASVGTVGGLFEIMNVWEKSIGTKSKTDLGSSWDKFSKRLSRRAGEVLTLENLERGGILGKVRKRQKSVSGAYDKEVQPLVMSYCLYANYRIIGGVFRPDEFSEALLVLRKTEKDRAAWLYTLFVASQLEPEIVYLQTSSGDTSISGQLFPPGSESESASH